jgi:hypothetical protein
MKTAEDLAEDYLKKHYEERGPTERIRLANAFLAGHSSRDPEVKALEERIKGLAHPLVQE